MSEEAIMTAITTAGNKTDTAIEGLKTQMSELSTNNNQRKNNVIVFGLPDSEQNDPTENFCEFATSELDIEIDDTVTETWLTEKDSDNFVHVDGYNVIRKDRRGKRGGVYLENVNGSVKVEFTVAGERGDCAFLAGNNVTITWNPIKLCAPQGLLLERVSNWAYFFYRNTAALTTATGAATYCQSKMMDLAVFDTIAEIDAVLPWYKTVSKFRDI
ncbi:hypothetical protein B566_EDAN016070 [Ephemera danica]|nr:hypothetical protein B566_EDAN016070 [Ephemera danica]